MKKIIVSAIALFGLTANAQKADVTKYDVIVNFDQPELFKNFKTISYELQDDGVFWNHEVTEEYPTLTSLTQNIEVTGLETVTENADLNFVVAFKGSKPTTNQGLIAVEGTYLMLLKTSNNQINKQSSGQAHEVFNGEKLILINENHPFSNFPHLPTRQASENSFRLN